MVADYWQVVGRLGGYFSLPWRLLGSTGVLRIDPSVPALKLYRICLQSDIIVVYFQLLFSAFKYYQIMAENGIKKKELFVSVDVGSDQYEYAKPQSNLEFISGSYSENESPNAGIGNIL